MENISQLFALEAVDAWVEERVTTLEREFLKNLKVALEICNGLGIAATGRKPKS